MQLSTPPAAERVDCGEPHRVIEERPYDLLVAAVDNARARAAQPVEGAADAVLRHPEDEVGRRDNLLSSAVHCISCPAGQRAARDSRAHATRTSMRWRVSRCC